MRGVRGWLLAGLALVCLGSWAQDGGGQVVPMRQSAGQWVSEYVIGSPFHPYPDTGWQASREQACALLPDLLNRQGINQGRQCGSRLVTPTCCGVMVFNSTPGACATGYMCDRAGGFEVRSRNRWIPPGSACPANAVPLDAARCQCTAGFQAVNGQCVEVPTPPLGCAAGEGGFTACPGNTPWVPAVRPAPGTPLEGGPSPNAGEPGQDASPDAIQPVAAVPAGSTCRAVEAVGNPIFAGTGNKYQREVDYQHPHGLSLVRHYNSSLPGWVHNFGGRVMADDQVAVVLRPDGRGLRFIRDGQGAWVPEPGTADRLALLPLGAEGGARWQYTVAATDTTEWYGPQGQLLRITSRNGRVFRAEHAQGLLAVIVDPWGRRLRFAYDGQRRLAAAVTPDGQEIRYSYDGAGRLARVTHPDASSRQYLYEDARWPLALTGIVDERGVRQASWAYDGSGRAQESTLAGGVGRHQLVFGDGAVRVRDPRGFERTQAYARTGARRTFSGQDAACPGCIGDAASRTVDPASGLVVQSVDFLGVIDTVTWHAERRLPRAQTQADGLSVQRTRVFQWHPAWALPLRVTEGDRMTDFVHDEQGNLLSRTLTDSITGQSRRWTHAYNAQGQVTRRTDPNGAAWQHEYDSQGNLQSLQDPLGRVHRFTHDVNGRLTAQVDPQGTVTTLTRDARGRVVARTVAGETTRLAHTPDGQLASVTLPNGHETRYGYDDAGRLVTVSDNRGMRTVFDLDAAGQRIRETVFDAGGQVVKSLTREFSAAGYLGAQRDAAGPGSRFEHDANGRLVARIDPLSQTTRRSLNGLGQTVDLVFPDGQAAHLRWNVHGELGSVMDPKRVTTRYEVNGFGEVTLEASPDIGVRRYVRDARGDVVQAEDAKGQVTQIDRDALGQPLRIVHADGRQSTMGYAATGRLATYEDASGRAEFERDALGRIVSKRQFVNDNARFPSSRVVRYRWLDGDLHEVDYPSGLTVRYHRQAGRIVGIDVQRPSGSAVASLLAGMMKARPAVRLVTNLTHTALGQPRAWDWFNGDRALRTFEDGRIVSTEFARYTHDAAGRITGIHQQLMVRDPAAAGRVARHPVAWQVGYDARDRITRFEGAGASVRYTYDANGNRLAAVESAGIDALLAAGVPRTRDSRIDIDAQSNRTQRITQAWTNGVQAGTSETRLGFDANGALTSDGRRRFDYDASGRLSATRTPQGPDERVVPYLHNVLGQRVFKGEPQASGGERGRLPPLARPTRPASVTGDAPSFWQWVRDLLAWFFSALAAGEQKTLLGMMYVYGDGPLPAWALLGEYDNGTAVGRGYTEYIWLPTEDGVAIPIGFYRDGRFHAVHTDHLGTPRLVTNDANEPVWQWPYSAFGDNRPIGVLDGTPPRLTNPAVQFNLGMPGQYWDEESQMFYNYHRTYCASCGSYLQPDPIGLEGGWNRYSYVGGDPMGRIDPTGLDFLVVTGGSRERSNPFGHTAVGITGAGLYSYGNNTGLGSGPLAYITDQAQYRDQTIIIIPRTLAQDQAALKSLTGNSCQNCVGVFDNCAVRTDSALRAGSVNTGMWPFPGGVARDAMRAPGATTYFVPQGSPQPQGLIDALRQFNPPNVP